MKQVTIYTDGSCLGNPGYGGWAAVLLYGDNRREISGGAADTTNNRMELTAVIRALDALKEPCEVTVCTDSQYIANAVNQHWLRSWEAHGWKRKGGEVRNLELWQELNAQLKRHRVAFSWVKGHDTDALNNRCDELAVAESQKLRDSAKNQP